MDAYGIPGQGATAGLGEKFLGQGDGDMNICLWCGRECDFIATCEGLCLYCGDEMQKKDKWELIQALVKAVKEVQTLRWEREK